MKTKDFILELNKEFNNKLELKQNRNVQEIGNIFYEGIEICPCPFEDIYEEEKSEYKVYFKDGASAPHPTTVTIKGKIKNFVNRLKTEPDFRDLMLGK